MKLLILICFSLLLFGCATRDLYFDDERPTYKTEFIASGSQEVINYCDECYFQHGNEFYFAHGLGGYWGKFDRITFWLDDESQLPLTYSVENKDKFIASGKISKSSVEINSSESIEIPGLVASSHSIRVTKMPLAAKIALTPFAFAIDVAAVGGIIMVEAVVNNNKTITIDLNDLTSK